MLVLTNPLLAHRVAEMLPEVPVENIIAEPRPAGTAPALAWAAREIARRDSDAAVMLCVHADWAVGDDEKFRATLSDAASAAQKHRSLVTVGIVPSRPDPGFGYIQPGEEVDGARRVERFVEKPDTRTAAALIEHGYLWNSGIFVWRAGDLLEELRALTPEVAGSLDKSATIEEFFAGVTPISIDHGVMERSERALVIPGEFAWDDVGTWAALRRVRDLDEAGNAAAAGKGSRVLMVDSHDNVVHSESGAVVLYGVSNLVVVTVNGLTMVTTTDRAADLKTLVDRLPPELRDRR
jgi:mannose-1-phosphate guanylyltransferase